MERRDARGRADPPSAERRFVRRCVTPLHVALVAPPWYPVPPHGYGGIELVVSLLDRELRRQGHHVSVLAAEGSPGAVVCAPRGWHQDLGAQQQGVREATYASRVLRAIASLGTVDVVHDHAAAATLVTLAAGTSTPVVHTVHGPLLSAERAFYSELGGRVGLVAISESQRNSAPNLNWIGRVFNAVDVDDLEVCARSEKEPYLLCLARICEDKGQHIAIEVARRAGVRLVLAGKIEATAAGNRYFDRAVAPHIDGLHVVHVPNAFGSEKRRLLSRATALLAPLQWDEPFGLATVEAMASGTPAIASRRGAAPELIDPGVTGFLVADVEEMVTAVRESHRIDPLRCAEVTRKRFNAAAMATGYLSLYERVARLSSAVA